MEFNWREFKNKKVAIHCKTEEEAKDFCEKAYEKEISWEFSSKGETHYRLYEDKTCYNAYASNTLLLDTIEHYKRENYKILEWEDFMEFKNEDLKAGYLVERNDGLLGIVAMTEDDRLCVSWENGTWEFAKQCSFKDDKLSIKEVYGYTKYAYDCIPLKFETEHRKSIWRRKEVQEMTLEEVCKELGKEVKIIK